MDVYEFGKELVATQDLDPVYVGLVGADLSPELLSRVCLAYWCFYSLGAACYIAEKPKKFWELMATAAANELPSPLGGRWPRAAERRHFRGAQAINAVKELTDLVISPHGVVDHICSGGSYQEVARRAQQLRGFGPWIAWKIADMAERVLGYEVDFLGADLGIYKEPRQGAALVAHGDWKAPVTDSALSQVVKELTFAFRSLKAPPLGDRKINVQEVETVLCKYKSHFKGHYTVGKDILEVRHGLKGWGDVAQQVLGSMPKCV